MVFICWWCLQCSSGGHSFTVGVHRYTARPGTIFYFTLLICIGFVLSYHLFFLFVCLFSFPFSSPPPILGIRSLAGGRREYGRSGREPLFLNPFFYMLVFRLFPFILSWSWVENAAIPHSVRTTFQCFHLFSHRIGFESDIWPPVLRRPNSGFTTKLEFQFDLNWALLGSMKGFIWFYLFNHLGNVVLCDLIHISSASPSCSPSSTFSLSEQREIKNSTNVCDF